MKLFISGKFNDKTIIRKYMDVFEKMGHTITFDWTSYEKNAADPKEMGVAAVEDINGVRDDSFTESETKLSVSDVHVIIITDKSYPYKGTLYELGCSLGLKKPIWMWNPFSDAEIMKTPFYWHPQISHFETMENLYKHLTWIDQVGKTLSEGDVYFNGEKATKIKK